MKKRALFLLLILLFIFTGCESTKEKSASERVMILECQEEGTLAFVLETEREELLHRVVELVGKEDFRSGDIWDMELAQETTESLPFTIQFSKAVPAMKIEEEKITVRTLDINVYKELAEVGNVPLIDVRSPEEFKDKHLEGAVNIPLGELNEGMDAFSKDRPVMVYCRSGNRSANAAKILARQGFTFILDMGGIRSYKEK